MITYSNNCTCSRCKSKIAITKPLKYTNMVVYKGMIPVSLPTSYTNLENKETDYYCNEVMYCSFLLTF